MNSFKEFYQHSQLTSATLREEYLAGKVLQLGEEVKLKDSEETGKIAHRGTNYVIVECASGRKRCWLDQVIAEAKRDGGYHGGATHSLGKKYEEARERAESAKYDGAHSEAHAHFKEAADLADRFAKQLKKTGETYHSSTMEHSGHVAFESLAHNHRIDAKIAARKAGIKESVELTEGWDENAKKAEEKIAGYAGKDESKRWRKIQDLHSSAGIFHARHADKLEKAGDAEGAKKHREAAETHFAKKEELYKHDKPFPLYKIAPDSSLKAQAEEAAKMGDHAKAAQNHFELYERKKELVNDIDHGIHRHGMIYDHPEAGNRAQHVADREFHYQLAVKHHKLDKGIKEDVEVTEAMLDRVISEDYERLKRFANDLDNVTKMKLKAHNLSDIAEKSNKAVDHYAAAKAHEMVEPRCKFGSTAASDSEYHRKKAEYHRKKAGDLAESVEQDSSDWTDHRELGLDNSMKTKGVSNNSHYDGDPADWDVEVTSHHDGAKNVETHRVTRAKNPAHAEWIAMQRHSEKYPGAKITTVSKSTLVGPSK